jgi:hypothetical protein
VAIDAKFQELLAEALGQNDAANAALAAGADKADGAKADAAKADGGKADAAKADGKGKGKEA